MQLRVLHTGHFSSGALSLHGKEGSIGLDHMPAHLFKLLKGRNRSGGDEICALLYILGPASNYLNIGAGGRLFEELDPALKRFDQGNLQIWAG